MKKRRFTGDAFRLGAALAILASASCATGGGSAGDSEPFGEPTWAANGWLTPGPTSEPEIIGLYHDKQECEDAVEAWMSRQVVGNPVFGDCLPIDTH